MKFLPLTFRNLMRRPVRTILVFLATTVAFLLFGILMILRVAFTMGVEVAGADRLMMIEQDGIHPADSGLVHRQDPRRAGREARHARLLVRRHLPGPVDQRVSVRGRARRRTWRCTRSSSCRRIR